MTLSEIKASTKPFLTAADVAGVIGCNPETIRWQAKANPALLGFPVTHMKSRTYIPRKPFLAFVEGIENEEEKNNVNP